MDGLLSGAHAIYRRRDAADPKYKNAINEHEIFSIRVRRNQSDT